MGHRLLAYWWDPDIAETHTAFRQHSEHVLGVVDETIDGETAKTLAENAKWRVETQVGSIREMVNRCYELCRLQIAIVVGYLGLIKIVQGDTHSAFGSLTLLGATVICLAAVALLPCLKTHPFYSPPTMATLGEWTDYLMRRAPAGRVTAHFNLTVAMRSHPIIEANELVARWIGWHLGISSVGTIAGIALLVLDLWI